MKYKGKAIAMITRILCEILKIGQKESLIFFFSLSLIGLPLCMRILSFISAVNQAAERVQPQQPAFDPALSALLYFDHYFAPRPFGDMLADDCRQRSLSDGFHLSPFSKKKQGAMESMSKICVVIGERVAGRKIGRLWLTARVKAERQEETAEEGRAVTGCSSRTRRRLTLCLLYLCAVHSFCVQ